MIGVSRLALLKTIYKAKSCNFLPIDSNWNSKNDWIFTRLCIWPSIADQHPSCRPLASEVCCEMLNSIFHNFPEARINWNFTEGRGTDAPKKSIKAIPTSIKLWHPVPFANLWWTRINIWLIKYAQHMGFCLVENGNLVQRKVSIIQSSELTWFQLDWKY